MVKNIFYIRKLKRRIKYICCFMTLFLVCAVSLNVQATEDSDIFASASAKVYTAMSEDSDVAANLIVGSMFEVLDAESDANGAVWYQVRTDFGAEGYVKADELDRVLAEAQQMQQQAQPQDPVQNEGAEGDGEADIPDNEEGEGNEEPAEGDNENPEANGEGDNALEGDAGANGEPLGELIVLESVNLRRMPSTGSEIMGRINLNTKLPYYEEYTNDADEVWYRVRYEGMTGYVTDGAVMIQPQEQQPNEERQLSGEEGVEPSTSVEEPVQERESVQKTQQSEVETIAVINQAEFEVDERPDVEKKHRHRGLDWMIVILVLGGALCIAAIFILLKRILKLLRK